MIFKKFDLTEKLSNPFLSRDVGSWDNLNRKNLITITEVIRLLVSIGNYLELDFYS